MKHLYKFCIGSVSAFLFVLFFTNASTGPGANFATGYTGAPFDGGAYCNSCHSGGNFTPLVTIQLLDANNQPATNYLPGAAYNVVLNISTATGLTSSTRYGFMIAAVQTPSNVNAGTWGSLSPDYHSVIIGGRTYIEHDDRLSSGIITIPWTAPATNQGNVTFYAAGNIVDFSTDPSGDNANIANITIPAVALPVTWLFFRGRNEINQIVLEWATTSELNNGHFLLEKSSDGEKYSELATINAAKDPAPTEHYSYTDTAPFSDNYYRISQVDVNGSKNIFRTIRIQAEQKPTGLAYVKGNDIVVMLSDQKPETAIVSLRSIDGRMVHSNPVNLLAGTNTIPMSKPAQNGLYIVSVRTVSEVIYTGKLLVE